MFLLVLWKAEVAGWCRSMGSAVTGAVAVGQEMRLSFDTSVNPGAELNDGLLGHGIEIVGDQGVLELIAEL